MIFCLIKKLFNYQLLATASILLLLYIHKIIGAEFSLYFAIVSGEYGGSPPDDEPKSCIKNMEELA